MSIYLTKQVSYSSKVQAFEDRGLSGHMSTKASESGVHMVSTAPLQNLIRYGCMDEELSARLQGKVMRYGNRMSKPLLSRFDAQTVINTPTLFTEMKSGGEVLNAYGLFETATSKMGTYAGTPTADQMSEVIKLDLNPYLTVPAGNVNLSGYLSFLTAWRGFVAFNSLGAGSLAGEELKVWVSREEALRLAGPVPVDAILDITGNVITPAVPGVSGGYFTVAEGTLTTGQNMILPFIERLTPSDAVDFKGLIFPYFKEMLESDADSTFDIFWRLFKRCVATSDEQITDAQSMYRRGFRNLAFSHAGRMIQHLYFGIQLAIDSGGRLIPIVDGAAYCGFVLKGDNLVVAVRNKIVKALEPEELQAQLRLLNTHQEAVEKIHQVVVELEKLRDLEDPSIESCTRNPRALRAMIQNRLATTLEPKKEKILELIQKLSYSQTFWDITSPNILRFLTLMDRKEDIFEEPMYIHGDVFFARASNILEYISVFGSQGPSIYEGTAAKQVCKPEDVDPNLHIIDGKRAVPHVPYKKTGIIQAAAGWATASKNHSFRYTPAKGKGMVTGFSDNKKRDGVIANPHFEAFYSSLRHWMYSSQTENLKQGKGKRKADTMEVDREDRAEGSSKKRITWF